MSALLDKARRRHAEQDKRERASTERLSAPKEETEMSPWIKATIDELSKKTLGSYVKKASDRCEVDAGMALQRTADVKNQTRADVDKHVGKG